LDAQKNTRWLKGSLDLVSDYERFHDELDKVWRQCVRVLVPGGRLICVVGDVCLSREGSMVVIW
jgi:hypothetical protein